jgi:hypothetical protein
MGRFEGVPLRDGDVQFRLAGQDWRIRYGRIAWSRLKRTLGVASELKCLVRAHDDEDALMALFHAGFSVWHPEVTLERARELFDEIDRPGERALDSAAWEAIGIALPALKALVDSKASGSDPKETASAKKKPTRNLSSKKR